MTYLSWAALYEGDTDASYFDVLIPRLLEDIACRGPRLPTIPLTPSVRLTRARPEALAIEACNAIEAFKIVFIHADTGGRALEEQMDHRGRAYCEAIRARCHLPAARCILITPRHETEAWVLADPPAVLEMLGYTGTLQSIGLPTTAAAAERLRDPKATLEQAASQVRGRRRSVRAAQIFPAVAQRQRLTELRRMASFRFFETKVEEALEDLHLF